MLDANRQHESTTASVLSNLSGGIAVTFHKRYKTGGSQGRIVDGAAFGTDVTQVVTHASSALHQLNLLLVYLHHSTITVCIAIKPYHKTVAQRCHLLVVANSGHRTSCGNDVAEMVQQAKHILYTQRIFILLLYSGNLTGNTPMHLFGRLLIDVAIAVFHGIFVDPHPGGQLVTVKIL